MLDRLYSWFIEHQIEPSVADLLTNFSGLVALLVIAWLANFFAKTVIVQVVTRIIRRTSTTWDDAFVDAGVFTRLSHIAPALVVTTLGAQVFIRTESWRNALNTGINAYLILIALLVIDAAINAVVDLYHKNSTTQAVPLKGFAQGAKLVIFLFGGILLLSTILGRSPLYFLSGLGALTAVLLLVFRDAILGFVAGIQISVNRMVQIGDWIEMSKYGADGDVIDVTLTTVKVQNWDKTVSTIPTYALISDSVKNWRGMKEAGGRRIKRALHIDVQTIKFVDEETLAKMMTFRRLRPYLEEKIPEIKKWNETEGEDLSVLVNGRRLTNIGCFRAYCVAYLRSHPKIHQNLTFLVRQLQPTELGLPIEIYVFVNDTVWANYEAVQADIFDHLFAVLGEFDLAAYQSPSGRDFRNLLPPSPKA